jgi:hypothetical protein
VEKPARTLADDVKWALAVMTGALLAALIFGLEWSLLLGAAVGIVAVVTVRVISRRR